MANLSYDRSLLVMPVFGRSDRLGVRWSIFACLFGFAFFAYVQRTSVAIAAERIMPELGLSQIEIGWLLTAFLVSYTVFQLAGGAIGQRWGARLTLLLATLLALVATLATAALPSLLKGAVLFFSLLAARFTLGIAQAPVFPVASGSIESWFPSARWSFPQGLLSGGINLGAAVTPPLVVWLMQSVSWQFALVATSIPLLVLTAYWSWHARDVPADHPAVSLEELDELRFNPPPAHGLLSRDELCVLPVDILVFSLFCPRAPLFRIR
jgi:MFS family permease